MIILPNAGVISMSMEFLFLIAIDLILFNFQVLRTCIKSWRSFNFHKIKPLTNDLAALEFLKGYMANSDLG